LHLEPEYIPKILLSIILFGLGSSLLLATLAAPSCLCPLVIVGQQSPTPKPPPYLLWGNMISLSLLGTAILVLIKRQAYKTNRESRIRHGRKR